MRAGFSSKGRKKGKMIGTPPRIPQPMERDVVALDRSGSLGGGSGEKERVVLERKLKTWRSEIWAAEDGMGSGIWAAADDDVVSRKGKMRRPRAMSCFNLAGQVAAEVEEDDDSSRSSWSSNSQR